MKDIRYAIFDMDGTLVDSMGYWLGLVDEALSLLPRDIKIPEKALEEIPTMGVRRAREYLASFNVDASDIFTEERSLLMMRDHYAHHIEAKAGAKEFLEELRKKGVRMVIATLTPMPLVELCLKKHGLYEYFEAFYTPEQYPEGKKEPRIFYDIMKHFGAPAEEIWLFEDSLYSVKTAKALGMRIAVLEEKTQQKNTEALLALSDAYFKNGFTERIK